MSESTHTNGTDGGHVNTTWKLGLSTLERFGVVIAFIALFAYNAITQPETFLKPENLRNLLNQNADIGVIAVGMTLVIIAGGIDLSVGAVMAFAAAVGMITMNSLFEGSMNETLAVIIGLATGIGLGAACGLLNGLLVTIGRIPAFIVTLAGLIGFRSVTLAIAEGGEIRAADGLTALQTFGRGGLEIPGVLDYYDQPVDLLLEHPDLLRGGHRRPAPAQSHPPRTALHRGRLQRDRGPEYSGIAVNRVRTWSYVLVGACAGIAALMSLARMNSVSSSGVGHLAELDAIAAVVIGGTAMTGGRGRVWGTMLGVLILIMISNMLTLADVEVYWQGFVKGVIIILAVLIQRGQRELTFRPPASRDPQDVTGALGPDDRRRIPDRRRALSSTGRAAAAMRRVTARSPRARSSATSSGWLAPRRFHCSLTSDFHDRAAVPVSEHAASSGPRRIPSQFALRGVVEKRPRSGDTTLRRTSFQQRHDVVAVDRPVADRAPTPGQARDGRQQVHGGRDLPRARVPAGNPRPDTAPRTGPVARPRDSRPFHRPAIPRIHPAPCREAKVRCRW